MQHLQHGLRASCEGGRQTQGLQRHGSSQSRQAARLQEPHDEDDVTISVMALLVMARTSIGVAHATCAMASAPSCSSTDGQRDGLPLESRTSAAERTSCRSRLGSCRSRWPLRPAVRRGADGRSPCGVPALVNVPLGGCVRDMFLEKQSGPICMSPRDVREGAVWTAACAGPTASPCAAESEVGLLAVVLPPRDDAACWET